MGASMTEPEPKFKKGQRVMIRYKGKIWAVATIREYIPGSSVYHCNYEDAAGLHGLKVESEIRPIEDES